MNPSGPLTTLFAQAPPAPVWLERAPAPPPDGTASPLVAAIVAATALASLTVGWAILRRRQGRSGARLEAAAFRAAAKRLGLSRAARRALVRISRLSGAPPLATLLSERVFNHALRRAETVGRRPAAPLLLQLERRLHFDEPGPRKG